MKKSKLEIVQTYEKLLDYFFSGLLAFVVLKTLREEFQKTQIEHDEIFISALYLSTYNTVVLVLANTVKTKPKAHDDSIHVTYLFNCIRESKAEFDIAIYSKLNLFMQEAEAILKNIFPMIDAAVTLRDTSVAHLDRKHINNPTSLISNPPIKWDDIETAYNIIGSVLFETGKLLDLLDIAPYTTLANVVLTQQTRKVFKLLYTPNEISSRKIFENDEE